MRAFHGCGNAVGACHTLNEPCSGLYGNSRRRHVKRTPAAAAVNPEPGRLAAERVLGDSDNRYFSSECFPKVGSQPRPALPVEVNVAVYNSKPEFHMSSGQDGKKRFEFTQVKGPRLVGRSRA